MMKLRLAKPEQLVDLQDLHELRGIRNEGGTLVIGAMTTQHELIGSDLLASCPIVRETALVIADPQVRYCGTLGGNLANGDPGNDMPAVMLALGATYRARGPQGERDIPAREFYRGVYSTALLDGEILTAIHIRILARCHGWAYEKQKRKVGDYTVQDFTDLPFMSTVQAPQWLVSQPMCGPVIPSSSRSRWINNRRGSARISTLRLLTVNLMCIF